VNIAGCFVMGILIALAEQTRWVSEEVRWLVATGFLGSLTTFSSLEADTFHSVGATAISGSRSSTPAEALWPDWQ